MASVSSNRRILSVIFPYLATDRIKRRARANGAPLANRPLVAIEKVKGALCLAALDTHAEEAGLAIGMTLATARALCPVLETVERDTNADRALLEHIADWMERYTPCVGLLPSDGIALDITGAAHLLGDEMALRRDLLARLAAQGFVARAAIAGTAETATALARFSDIEIVAPDEDARAVDALPIAALGLPSSEVIALARLGLKSIVDLASRPRAPLAARFGADLIARLDRVRGVARTSITPRRFIPPFITERRFAEPIGHEDDIHRSILTLAADLARLLEKQGLGGRRFELTFFRADGATRRMGVETARPLRDPKTLMRLFRERLDALADPLDPGFGFDLMRLTSPVTEIQDAHEPDFDGANDLKDDLIALVERLGIRLHPARLMAENTHWPERASRARPAQEGNAALASDWDEWHEPSSAPLRPIRLFDLPEPIDVIADVPDGPPVRFRWRRVFHVVVKAEGPERIAPEWWRMTGDAMPVTRDYYRIENETGARFWVFRSGLYDRDATPPRWFMHGVFG